jgi:gluconokinase
MVRATVPVVPAGLWCYRVDAQRALLGGATSEGGNVYAWLRRTLQLPEPQETKQMLASMLPDAHGLTILPLWAGERSPGWAGNAKASIVGMTMATTPIEILRASLEGVAYRFAMIAERLLVGSEQAQIVVSGGGLQQSAVWTQICADVLGQALVLSQEPEATSRGVALLALEAIGAIADVATMPAKDGALILPDMDTHAVYWRAIERQRQLYGLLLG